MGEGSPWQPCFNLINTVKTLLPNKVTFWEGKQLPTPLFLPGESHGQRSLAGYSPQGHKELDMTEWHSPHFTSEVLGLGP